MIVSASRRTDIPAFYAEWFMQRVRTGFCTVPNPFNAKQVSHVSLASEDVNAFVFWTRNVLPLLAHLPELDRLGYHYVFLYTLVDYPRWLEIYTPPIKQSIVAFRELAYSIGPERIVWRYDPLVFTRSLDYTYHRAKFATIADALAGYTQRVVVSVVDEYAKTRRRLDALEEEAPLAKASLAGDEGFAMLMKELALIAEANGMQIQSCAETLDLTSCGVQPGACIDGAWLNELFGLALPTTKDPSQREQCGCVVSKDIGMYNTCLYGCQYCYATGNFDSARERYQRHDANATSLITYPHDTGV